jgi:hypothetical protein
VGVFSETQGALSSARVILQFPTIEASANVTISKQSDDCVSQQIMETDLSMGKFDQWQKICLAILDHDLVISCPNVTKWTEWMEESFADGTHWIATDDIEGFRVETVFLEINHNIPTVEPPLWFETMVFRESADGTHGVKIEYDTLRYSTVADALAGHVVICEKVHSGEIGE